jgi:glycosyltransferase involved in cell wall biosynthesis
MNGSNLRILAVHRYYWPDTPPYASMLRRIAGRWHEDGHCVDVLSSQPSYKTGIGNIKCADVECIDGIKVERLKLPSESGRPLVRVFNALRLALGVIWRALWRRYDVIMISTSPPVLGGVAVAFAAKLTKARFIYHCMDIHPEVGRVSGEFSHPFVFSNLRKLDVWSCRKADPVIVLSEDMKRTLCERRGGNDCTIKVLNNFSLPVGNKCTKPLPFEYSSSKLSILFAGNIGRFQGLESIVKALALLDEQIGVELVLMGEGTAKVSLQKMVAELGVDVRFVDHQSVDIAMAAMQQADLGLVSLIPDIYRYAYPSKTMTYLEQGCPVLVAVEAESELAKDVEGNDYGFVVPVGDSEALANLLEKLAVDTSWQDVKRCNARKKAQESYAESVVLDKWSDLLKKHEWMQ